MLLSPLFHVSDFSMLPGWYEDGQSCAYAAFRLCALKAQDYRYKTGRLGVDIDAFADAFAQALQTPWLDDNAARRFFERHFTPCRIVLDDAAQGFVTGFYEPEVAASRCRTEKFQYPLLGVPDDLVKITDANRPLGLDPYLAFGRLKDRVISEYFDRAAIENGTIEGRAAAIAWLADPVDVFFIHVQGAARLIMPDGQMLRIAYAAKSGQRFTGPGHVLASMGEIPAADVTMQSIRGWFHQNPHRINEILHQNRSYIFFKIVPASDADNALGPVAAAKVPLMPGRSIAVDRLLHTFGTPVFIDAPALRAFGGGPFQRLMIAQDTGSAIIGPARGDLFTGSGEEAGEIAGIIKHQADFFALLPRRLIENSD